jgi:lysophospholipase L1-like esterase
VTVLGWSVGQPSTALAVPSPGQLDPPVTTEEPIVYTALGDSIATGIWSSAGYVRLFADHLQSDLGAVRLNNLAVNGWTTADLLEALRTNETYREAVRTADVVTLSIGGNDLLLGRGAYIRGNCGESGWECLRSTTDAVLENYDAILDEIQALVGPRPAVIRAMDVYNPYAGVDTGALDVLKPYLDEINSYICWSAEVRSMGCARVYEAFNGPSGEDDPVAQALIGFDGIHPNDRGHGLIADLLRDVGYAPLR